MDCTILILIEFFWIAKIVLYVIWVLSNFWNVIITENLFNGVHLLMFTLHTNYLAGKYWRDKILVNAYPLNFWKTAASMHLIETRGNIWYYFVYHNKIFHIVIYYHIMI